jgi:hypothetical protein
VPLAREDLPSSNHDRDVIKAVPALWPKIVSFTVEELGVNFTDDGVPAVGWGETAATVFVDEIGGVGTRRGWGPAHDPRPSARCGR